MSGYNYKTGLFELTFTKARYWLRRQDIPEECQDLSGMEYFACILRKQGLEVVHVDNAFLRVRATQGQIWEALSGQPSSPSH